MKWNRESGADPEAHDRTRRHLLAVAGEVFAAAGFRNATVREICERAKVNIAAVNYHFGDKQGLYAEVLRFSQQRALEKYPPLLGVAADAPAEDKLAAFVRSLLLRVFDTGPIAWHGKLMLREMIEPTPALDAMVAERIRPMAMQLWEIVADILNCRPDSVLARQSGFSVVSQCFFYYQCRPVVARLYPEQQMDAAAVEQLAGHITRFSLAAMKNLRESETSRPPLARRVRRRK